MKKQVGYVGGLAVALAAGPVFAQLDTTDAVTAIEAATTPINAIALAIIGVVATIFAIRKVRSLLKG